MGEGGGAGGGFRSFTAEVNSTKRHSFGSKLIGKEGGGGAVER